MRQHLPYLTSEYGIRRLGVFGSTAKGRQREESDNARDQAFLHDVGEAIHRIHSYTAGIDYGGCQADTKTEDAVIRNLEIVGEATKQLSEAVRQQAPTIPWRNIARMRDKLIHHYFGVNLDIVWNVIQDDLPPLLTAVKGILATMDVPKK